MRPMRGVQHFSDLSEETIQEIIFELGDDGWSVFVLPRGIHDQTSFFVAVRDTFPLDPPLSSNHSWDALEDSLSAGLLLELDETRIAIIWPGSEEMASADRPAYEIAIDVLTGVCDELAHTRFPRDNVKQLAVIVGRFPIRYTVPLTEKSASSRLAAWRRMFFRTWE